MNRRTTYFLFLSMLALGAFWAIGLWSISPHDWPMAAEQAVRDVRNLSGPFGSALADASVRLVGSGFAWIFPGILVWVGFGLAVGRGWSAGRIALKAAVLTILFNVFFALDTVMSSAAMTGAAGTRIAETLSSMIGGIGATILLTACLLIVLLKELRYFGRLMVSIAGKTPDLRPVARAFGGMFAWAASGLRETKEALAERVEERREARELKRIEAAERQREHELRSQEEMEFPHPKRPVTVPVDAPWASDPVPPVPERRIAAGVIPKRRTSAPEPARAGSTSTARPLTEAALPSLSLLKSGEQQERGFTTGQLEKWSEVLEDKLKNYGIEGRVTAVNQGPVVTTFEFEPAPGVRIKDIVSRSDDLALAMRARSLRLIAPIPGRAVVGIEIPNPKQDIVYLRDILEEIPDRLRMSGVMIGLGADAIGKAFHMNLCSAPHLLIAGTTGSGKSVSLNTLLGSILLQYRPTEVRLLLIDPKMVEMTVYDGIPHLLHPVITDPRDAPKVLSYLIREMERRNMLLRDHGVKNIESFNSKITLGKIDPEHPQQKLPYIILIVDEFADLVLQKGADIESLMSRLANMARAVGIHMVVATQRPSVDVIVGKTKANFPTRIAFRVASKVDSRTILDVGGAEKLLGRGDMLYIDSKHPEALRLHGSWLSEEELEAIVGHWKKYEYEAAHLELHEETSAATGSTGEQDGLFYDAKDVVVRYHQGSTSLLQRKLHVGYARAARLIDQLEEAGIVGPPDGSKAREVYLKQGEEVADPLAE